LHYSECWHISHKNVENNQDNSIEKYVQKCSDKAAIENAADLKIIADGKIMAGPNILADGEIPTVREKQADGKILAGVEISASDEIHAAIEKPAVPEKQATCLLFRLSGISSCVLLPGLADELSFRSS
jgi:hypothetical protein